MSIYETYGTEKPERNCRTCNDFKFWSKKQRQIFHKSDDPKDPDKIDKIVGSAGDNNLTREDCPLDKTKLGQYTWGLLHTMAAFYSDNPTDYQKKDMKTFFEVFSRLYPCEYCAKDFRKDLEKYPINVDTQKELSQWLCQFHNRVNAKLEKPLFDCSKVNERWRDGWLDGSCD